MNAVTMPVRSILLTGLAMGLLGDLLLRAPSGPGVNVLLLFVALSASIWFVTSVANTRVDIEGIICIVLGVIFAIGLVWRGSPVLRGLSFLSAATAFSLPALQAGGRWLRGSEITDVLEAVGGSAIHSAFGTIRLFGDRKWEAADPRIASGPGRALAGKVLRGAFLAAPLIVVFGGLFMSADRVFSTIVTDVVRIDLDALISHLIGITAVAWLTAGYLGGFLTGTRIRVPGGSDTPGPALGIVEVATALALLDLLFLGFVVVQLRYLFGGATLVEVTPGLTYAEYARQGFFQLVAATALVLPWLLAADWLLRGETGRGRLIFAVLGATQLSLLLVIVASALERMRVYQAVYGLTELRFFVTAFLIWLTVVMLWFAATVLRGKRGPFAFGALVSAFALVGGLHVVNPDAAIARTNLRRASETPAAIPAGPAESVGPTSIDAVYLGSLSSDAVPELLQGLDGLPSEARCLVSRRLLQAWGPRQSVDWRSWNWSLMQARRAVKRNALLLWAAREEGRDCG